MERGSGVLTVKACRSGLSRWSLLYAALLLMLTGCGRFGPPKPPEVFAPKKVSEIKVTPSADKVSFSWRGPDRDLRGRELKSMDGYRIMKAAAKDVREKEMLDAVLEEVGFVPDPNIEELNIERKEARSRGELGHRLKVPEEKKTFSFEDGQVGNGESYYYRIIPLNQDGVKGEPSDIIKVFFKGDKSDVFMVKDEAALDRVTELNAEEEAEEAESSGPGEGLFKMRD